MLYNIVQTPIVLCLLTLDIDNSVSSLFLKTLDQERLESLDSFEEKGGSNMYVAILIVSIVTLLCWSCCRTSGRVAQWEEDNLGVRRS
jgi:hypothetical protein